MNEEELKAIEKRMKKEAQLLKQTKKLPLKPCPFCGKKAAIILNGRHAGRYAVGCVNPRCVVSPTARYGVGGYVEDLPELIDEWNTRSYE